MIRIFPPCSSNERRDPWRFPPGSDGSRRGQPSLRRPWSNNPVAVRRRRLLSTRERLRFASRSRRSCRSAPRRVDRSRRRSARATRSSSQPLLVLLDDLLQIGSHFRNWLARHLHFGRGSPAYDDVELRVARILFRKIIAKVPTAALLSLEGSASDDLRDRKEILQVERGMPPWIVLPIPGDGYLLRSLAERLEAVERTPHFILAPHNADQFLHHDLKIVFDLIGAFTAALPVERLQCRCHGLVRLPRIYFGR